MNFGRLAVAAIAATVVDFAYGFLVYGILLNSELARYPNVFRPTDVMNAKMPIGAVGILVAMFAVAYMYAKGYEGDSGLQEGMRFGVLIGFLAVGYFAVTNYVVLNIGRRLAGSMAVAGMVEWVAVGVTMGAIYKPAVTGAAARRPARV